MALQITIPDGFFEPGEEQRLRSLLELSDGDDLTPFVLAALAEYKEMLLGSGVPSRSEEVKQFRLYCLLRHFFKNRIPTEVQVSSMFQLTDSQSRSLLRNTRSRYRQRIESQVRDTLKATIQRAQLVNTTYEVVIYSDNVVEALNALIEQHAPGCSYLSKAAKTARTYELSQDTHSQLCTILGLPVPQVAG